MDSPITRDTAQNGRLLFRDSLIGFATSIFCLLAVVFSLTLIGNRLGDESVSIYTLSATLQSVMRVLDLGFTTAIMRELASSSRLPSDRLMLAEKSRSYQRAYIIIGGLLAVALAILSSWLANSWFSTKQMSVEHLYHSLVAISLHCGICWINAYHQTALVGLHATNTMNAIRASEAAIALAMTITLCAFASFGIRAILLAQLLAAAASAWLYASNYDRLTNPTNIPVLCNFRHLWELRQFAIGMAITTLFGLILTNMDRVLLSHRLPLAEFGAYSLASYAASTAFGVAVTPLYNVLLPRLTRLSIETSDRLPEAYSLTNQALASLSATITVLLFLVGPDVLPLLNPTVAHGDVTICFLLITLGCALNTLMVGPYMLAVASGKSIVPAILTILQTAIFLPLLICLAWQYGPTGAALNFTLMNSAYLVTGLLLTHRFLYRSLLHSLITRDLLPAASLAICTIFLSYALPWHSLAPLLRVPLGTAVTFAILGICIACNESLRRQALLRFPMLSGYFVRPNSTESV